MIKNKIKDYPVLNNQQLLSLIRANQIMIEELAKQVQDLSKRFK